MRNRDERIPDLLRCVVPLLRATLLVAAITLGDGVAWAQTRIDPNGVNVSGSVIGDDVPTASAAAVPCRWAGRQHAGHRCGGRLEQQPDLRRHEHHHTTLQNQLNGITNGFQTIMSNVIQNATAAVAHCRP